MNLQKLNLTAKKAVYGMVSLIPLTMGKLVAFADGEEGGSSIDTSEFDWIKGEGNGSLDSLTETVQGTGASLYKLMMAIGIVGLVLIIGFCGIRIAAAGSGKRADELFHLLWILLGGVVFFGAITILGFTKSVAMGI